MIAWLLIAAGAGLQLAGDSKAGWVVVVVGAALGAAIEASNA